MSLAYPPSPTMEPDLLTPLEQRRRQQAERLGCFTELEIAELTGYTLGTLETYRRRGTGLPWLRVGPEVLYPCDAVREQLHAVIRFPRC